MLKSRLVPVLPWFTLLPAVQAHAQSGELADLTPLVERYSVDRRSVRSFYGIDVSPTRLERLDRFGAAWEGRLADVDFHGLERGSRIDYLLLENHIAYQKKLRERMRGRLAEVAELLPFSDAIVALEEARWTLESLEPSEAAAALSEIADQIQATRERVRKETDEEPGETETPEEEEEEEGAEEEPPLEVSPVVAHRLARHVDELKRTLETWFEHYDAFVPGFAWWTREPYEAAENELKEYADLLRKEIAGQKGEDDDPLIGDPIGRDAILEDLAYQMITYSPEELIAIGREQFAWCEDEMERAARELGFEDDWKDALEHVKGLHVDPGEQDALVAAQAREATAFLEEHDLVTVPELCRETWRVRMIDEKSQRMFPFAAYGGQEMLVAFPTADMDHEAKLEAMRGNNVHFTRAVTPHELIPGHHLQGFMAQRYGTHRRTFSTPFLGEGWAVYWEMLEWDLGWPKGPEDRIGMLFWRMHRAARIIISLGFHLGEMEPEEMIDFLVERVGHERDNATSEVRRYISGGYGPLYQCAYMIGALQLRALHSELVQSGRMTNRAFHDAILRENAIPIEMIRAALTDQALTPDYRPDWRFAGEVSVPAETRSREDG